MVSASSWFRLSALARRVSSARAIGMGTTDPNAWISCARCPVSGAALRATFAGVDVFITASRSSEAGQGFEWLPQRTPATLTHAEAQKHGPCQTAAYLRQACRGASSDAASGLRAVR